MIKGKRACRLSRKMPRRRRKMKRMTREVKEDNNEK